MNSGNTTPKIIIWRVQRYYNQGIIEEHVPVNEKGKRIKSIDCKYFAIVTVTPDLAPGISMPPVTDAVKIEGAKTIGEAYKMATPFANKKAEEMMEEIRKNIQEKVNGPNIVVPQMSPPPGILGPDGRPQGR